MSLYLDCLKLNHRGKDLPEAAGSTELESQEDSHLTLPAIAAQNVNWILPDSTVGIYYISDIHLFHQIKNKFRLPPSDAKIEMFISKFVSNMLTKDFRKDGEILFIGGDVSASFKLSTLFYTELKRQLDEIAAKRDYHYRKVNVYVVLGNHELWDFNTLDECITAYRQMLSSLGFVLLFNEEGCRRIWRQWVQIEDADGRKRFKLHDIDPVAEPELCSAEMAGKANYIIIGGTGFAGCNEQFNADNGIYARTLDREGEIRESDKWAGFYRTKIEEAKRLRATLIILTHFPITDWMGQHFVGDPNCIYFTGHDHYNHIVHDDDRSMHIFADNQVGYKGEDARLEFASLYVMHNPFAGLDDGTHEITPDDYRDFSHYLREREYKTKQISNYVKDGSRFYMVKKSGYYGFFLLSNQATYICAGGRVKWIGRNNTISYYYDWLDRMIGKYIDALRPLRTAQEEVSAAVKSFGGIGTIHGCIVDIDFFSHIMINPNDGTVTYYYSPDYGVVQSYETLDELLEEHAPKLLENKKANEGNALMVLNQRKGRVSDGLVKVELSGGMYGMSRDVQQIQRLFTCHVLRDWDEEIL